MLVFVVFLLGLSTASSLEFKTVYEWGYKEMDYSWPTEESRAKAVQDGTFKPENMEPKYIAAYKERLYLSLLKSRGGVPVTLVSLPKSSVAGSAPPKLDPFPNWQMHSNDSCNSIHCAKGLEVDPNGHLWVLDRGSVVCRAKLWIFNLEKSDTAPFVHHFPETVVNRDFYSRDLRDLVLDKTPDDIHAYAVDPGNEHVVVFSLRKNQSWSVKTRPAKRFRALALSPKVQNRLLYLGQGSHDAVDSIYSIAVSDLRANVSKAKAQVVAGLSRTRPAYRMLFDNADVLYTASLHNFNISAWHISEPIRQQRIYQAGILRHITPFSFTLDFSETLWMTVRNETGGSPRHKLLKAAVHASSYLFSNSSAVSETYPLPTDSTTSVQNPKERSACNRIADEIRHIRDLIDNLISTVQPCHSSGGLAHGSKTPRSM